MADSPTQKDTFTKFMDGELDLATSFWGFLIVGSAIVGFVCGFLMGAYGKGWVVPMVIWTYLAVGGTWQAAEKYKIEAVKKKQTELWGFLAQAVCVMNVVSVANIIFEWF